MVLLRLLVNGLLLRELVEDRFRGLHLLERGLDDVEIRVGGQLLRDIGTLERDCVVGGSSLVARTSKFLKRLFRDFGNSTSGPFSNLGEPTDEVAVSGTLVVKLSLLKLLSQLDVFVFESDDVIFTLEDFLLDLF